MTVPSGPVQGTTKSPMIGAAGTTKFMFGTKGETLELLAQRLSLPRLCEQTIFLVERWLCERSTIIDDIKSQFPGRTLAIRSSNRREDGWDESNAGSFLSLTDVAATATAIAAAVDGVIASYGADVQSEQVLVQPMVDDVVLSGVVLTRDLDTGSPYYVINYDDFSGRTDTVTGGIESKTVLVHRANPEALHSPRMRKLIAVVQEIETVTESEELDIEFCVTSDIDVFVLQVRPLVASRQWQPVSDILIDETIATVRDRIARLQQPLAGIGGSTTILGEMPDWNPAEMIGNAPRRLALSLYKRLITERVWADARARMGYRMVDRPLMLDLAGRPYIDVRLSLNSFLPKGLDDALAHRVVNGQIAHLGENPELHDKIEFEIAVTCRDVAFTEQARRLAEFGLTAAAVATLGDALGALTRDCLANYRNTLGALLASSRRLLTDDTSGLTDKPLCRADRLLEQTAVAGTLPFSLLARHAFIGVSFLRAFVRRGVLDGADIDRFMRSIHTVAADVVTAMSAVTDGSLDQDAFLSCYGHLRPGTYDIVSWRYDERPELYMGHARRSLDELETFHLDPRQKKDVGQCLIEEGYDLAPETLFDYISTAISAREEAKFAFTRGVSDALVAIGEWGADHGLSRDETSNLAIEDILSSGNDREYLRDAIERGREAHLLTRALRLPHLIVEPDDLDVVRPLRGQPTFITGTSITAKATHLRSSEVVPLHGHIVMIESADPGYDWIFSHDIRGLITKYGGTNSHMAIRCAEFNLPAAIGCGERRFGELLNSPVVELNCAARKVVGH